VALDDHISGYRPDPHATYRWTTTRDTLEAFDLEEVIYPRYVFGPLDARLEFLRFRLHLIEPRSRACLTTNRVPVLHKNLRLARFLLTIRLKDGAVRRCVRELNALRIYLSGARSARISA
jgi:hypothetical protein